MTRPFWSTRAREERFTDEKIKKVEEKEQTPAEQTKMVQLTIYRNFANFLTKALEVTYFCNKNGEVVGLQLI